MNHPWGSFLLPPPLPGSHSWDQQDVTSVQTLGKRGAWQASPSANPSFPLLPNSLNLGPCQVHWKRHLPEVFVGEQLPMVMKGKGKGLRLEGSGCPQSYWGPFGCLSGCQEPEPWLLLWPTCVIFVLGRTDSRANPVLQSWSRGVHWLWKSSQELHYSLDLLFRPACCKPARAYVGSGE